VNVPQMKMLYKEIYSCVDVLYCLGLPDAFVSVNIVEVLGKQLTNPGEMVRGYATIAIGYLTFNPTAKRQTLNMFVVATLFAVFSILQWILCDYLPVLLADVVSYKMFSNFLKARG